MEGQIFTTAHCGQVVVSHYQNRDKVTVRFTQTGYTITTTKDRLTKTDRPHLRDPLARSVFGVGCIGVGPHKAHVKGADTKPYAVWRSMLRRCYYRGSKHHQKSYEGKTVCDAWLCFQTFACWYANEHPGDGLVYQLDKDIKAGHSMVYSPGTCSLVTQAENLAARRAGKFSKNATGHA